MTGRDLIINCSDEELTEEASLKDLQSEEELSVTLDDRPCRPFLLYNVPLMTTPYQLERIRDCCKLSFMYQGRDILETKATH